MRLFSLFVFLAASLSVYGQDTDGNSNTGKLKRGYIVKVPSGDTVQGYLKKWGVPGIPVEHVDFKRTPADKRVAYRTDSISAFGYDEIVYRYFEQSDWSKLISNGNIQLYKGAIPSTHSGMRPGPSNEMGMASYTTDVVCYALVKDGKVKFVDSRATTILQTEYKVQRVMKKETLNSIKEFVSDDDEIVNELLSIDFRFKQLPDLIKKYNAHKRQADSR
jgi:hypothetical protein